MITPSFGLTATERVLPKLALDFTTASLDSRITFTRTGNTATVVNSFGMITAINADLPRFDYDPTTLACNGLLIEEARTNLLLNSLIDGTSLTTQAVVTTAVSTTLSFYGTGQIVLSGTSSATVVGTGAYPSRKTYTFTPTAGALTLTVTGTVQYAQLEVGAFATSFIPTAATSVIRNTDVATMTGTNFSDWYNVTQGTFVATGSTVDIASERVLLSAITGVGQRACELSFLSTGNRGIVVGGSVAASLLQSPVISPANYAMAIKANDFALSVNANTVLTDTSGALPAAISMNIGRSSTGTTFFLCGIVKYIRYYSQRLTNAEVQAFSK